VAKLVRKVNGIQKPLYSDSTEEEGGTPEEKQDREEIIVRPKEGTKGLFWTLESEKEERTQSSKREKT